MRWGWKLTVPLALATVVMATCFAAITVNAEAQVVQGQPDHISVLLFYHKGCCDACGQIEKYVGDALNQYYPNELKTGKISYQVADPTTDTALANKYGVKTWALKLVTTRNGHDTVIDVPEIWMYAGNKDAAMNTVKSAIDKQMGK
ncbi:MAG TPA: hypothetical protein VK436_09800 [Methanocella sp.]|nr:hypothetical protein [Methanocella sp.]